MGVTYIDGTATGPNGKRVALSFLVDSGASYTLLTESAWKALDLRPKRSLRFSLADGTAIDRDVSECYLELPQGDGHSPVVLGQPGDQPLLGVVTLEILGLILNPFNRTLQPMRTMLS